MGEVLLKEDILIEKSILDHYEELLLREDIDYQNEGWGKYECVFKRTAKFKDGFEVDLKVCINEPDDHDCWSEAVLFDENGNEVDIGEVQYNLRGEWRLSWYDKDKKICHTYVIDVKEK